MRPRISNRRDARTLGIDIVELKTAQSFYDRHRGRLTEFFTEREMHFIEGGPRPAVRFAMLWAAKEAAMKSLGFPALGPADLAEIEIEAEGRQKAVVSKAGLGISFIHKKEFVVASCYALGSAG